MSGYLFHRGPDRTGIDLVKAARNLPLSEVRAVIQSAPETPESGPRLVKDEDLPLAVVRNRIGDPICNWCWKKGETPLFYCTACHCTWFCSELCREADDAHRAWCCNPDAAPDTGPLRMTLVLLDKPPPSQAECDREMADMAALLPARQAASTAAVQLHLKEAGNAHYAAGAFQLALTCYTAGIRVPGAMTDLRKSLWMNRARAYSSLGLPMLAYVDVWLLEAGLGASFTTAKDLLTLANFQTQVGEVKAARHTLEKRLVGLEGVPEKRVKEQLALVRSAEVAHEKRVHERSALPVRNTGSTSSMTPERAARMEA
jgi:hypothetical protein